MRRTTRRIPALLLVLALILAACGGDSDDTTTTVADATTETTAADTVTETTTAEETTTTTLAEMTGLTCDEPVTVGVVTDLTGPLAIYGAHINRGVPIGFAYATGGEVGSGLEQSYMVDDCEIRVIFKDDQSNPELTATAGRELIEIEGADIIIGTVSSGATASLQSLAIENNIILIAAPAAATDITGKDFNENTFRASRNNYQDAMAICEQFVNGDGYKTFVQIAPDYSFGYGGAAGYKDACTFAGGEFIADDVFAPADTTDFTSYLEPLADTDADAFLVTWAGGGFVPLLQGALDLGVVDEDTVLGSPFVDNIVMPAFFANAIGSTASIIYHYTAADNAINDYLIEKDAELGAFPDLFDADGMNAAIMVVEAIRATNGAVDADSLRAALEGMSFEGPKGTIEIRAEDHVAIQDMYIVKLLNVDDPEFKYYEYVGTVRPEPPCLLEGDFTARCGNLPTGSLSGS
ncbi:MAG TPA: ABC transporter substrate-binding protein [Acidimicrobiia bacterium]|nr:ABC transporter substrate-binding protein [Acidimicrobiia bacterium]